MHENCVRRIDERAAKEYNECIQIAFEFILMELRVGA